MKRYLLFSVDTEPDDPLWQGLHRGGWTHENLRGLPRLAGFCRDLGVKPTFYISHSVAVRVEAAGALLPLLREGMCEVGAHLHPGDTPPFGHWDRESVDNVLKVPESLLEAKFANLHWEIWSRFGRPTSYRSAAWTLDGRVVKLLERHGYTADSSVTPGVSWRLNGRPSYLHAPRGAYRLGYGDPAVPGNSGIIEVPVSVWSPRRIDPATWAGRMQGDWTTMPMAARKGPVVDVIRALRPPPPQWIRPAFKSLPEMEEIARRLEGEEFLHVMCHSNEVWAGASPYVKTGEDLEAFYARLEGFFRYALAKGYIPASVSEYGAIHAASAGGGPPRTGAPRGADFGPRPESAPEMPASPPSRARWTAIFLAKAAVSCGALYLALDQVDWSEMYRYLAQVDAVFAVACLAAVLCEIGVNAGKMTLLLLPARVPALAAIRINFIKNLFNSLLPGGLGGEAVRTYLFARKTGSMGLSAAAIAADRMTGLWTQVLFTSVSLPFLADSIPSPGIRAAAVALAAGIAVLAGVLVLGPGPRLLGAVMRRLPGLGADRHLDEVERFRSYWLQLSSSPSRIAVLAGYCLASQMILIVTLWFATRALGSALGFSQASPILLFVGLSAVIPLSLGGLGILEGAFAIAFALGGSRPELGLLVALLLRVVGLVPAAAGGILYLKAGPLPKWAHRAFGPARMPAAQGNA